MGNACFKTMKIRFFLVTASTQYRVKRTYQIDKYFVDYRIEINQIPMTALNRIPSEMTELATPYMHGLSPDLETGCPNEGFIDFWMSKVWYKVHTTNEINHIYLQILLF